MRNVTCPHCNETVPVPDGLAQAHCVRCGQTLTPETNITAAPPASARAIQAEAYVERPANDAAPELPERYANWEEFRSLSPAVQRELMRMATRALPDLRGIEAPRLPVDAPDEVRTWGRPLGGFDVSGGVNLWQLFGYVALAVGALMLFGGALLILRKMIAAPRELGLRHDAGEMLVIVFFGVFAIVMGVYCAFFRGARGAAILWIFEDGAFLLRAGQKTTTRWENFLDFEFVTDARRPAYWLTLDRGVSVKVDLNGSPECMPLMEYIEIRLSAAQFLDRLKSIVKGNREPFGIVALDPKGFEGPRFFAPWPEVRRVIADSQQLFVDWSREREWVGIPYEYVSFPHLVLAIAAVMIDEHQRLASIDT